MSQTPRGLCLQGLRGTGSGRESHDSAGSLFSKGGWSAVEGSNPFPSTISLARSSKAERSPDKRVTTERYRPGQPLILCKHRQRCGGVVNRGGRCTSGAEIHFQSYGFWQGNLGTRPRARLIAKEDTHRRWLSCARRRPVSFFQSSSSSAHVRRNSQQAHRAIA